MARHRGTSGDPPVGGRTAFWILLCAMLWALTATPVFGQSFSSGSTGANGAFPPITPPTGTTGMVLDLNTGVVTFQPGGTTVTLPNVPPGGFTDGVLNFTTVTIASGITFSFARNAANTPVTLLASGNVTIAGTISVSGADATSLGRGGKGGPGGFDGGVGGDGVNFTAGSNGFGPGGGGGGLITPVHGGGGSFGSAGVNGSGASVTNGGLAGTIYGTTTLLPIIGGSGGGGGSFGVNGLAGGGGGGGGGALLIASSGTITHSGLLTSRGGNGVISGGIISAFGGGGSGGAIRLIASTITGSGQILVIGGGGFGAAGVGGQGRIRLEASTLTFSGTFSTLPTNALPASVFPPAGQPTLAITSVGGIAAPASPQGSFLTTPDITLPSSLTNPVTVNLVASNIPVGTTVQVKVNPQGGAAAAVNALLTGTTAASTASASVTLSNGVSVISATATFVLPTTASIDAPTQFAGEPITQVRVASVYGGGPSTLTYITASGKEISASGLIGQ